MSKLHGDAFYEWDGKHHWRLDGSYARTDDIEFGLVPDRLRGRTIVEVSVEEPRGRWPQGNDLALRLDDGSVFIVRGWGYDAWGIDVLEVTKTEFCEEPMDAWQNKRCVNPNDWVRGERDITHKRDLADD